MANPTSRGQQRDKPFRNALRMEIAEAGADFKRLRTIAAKLLTTAEAGDIAAIREVADRLDGKPAQEATVHINRTRAEDIDDNELADIATGSSEGTAEASHDPSQLN